MRRLVFVVMLAGCHDAQESDLDGDGLADLEDDCVDGFPDAELDVDDDGKDATQDLCPHDKNAVAGDRDFDGIPDACDPFPAITAGDTRRCITGFRVPWMNASHLDARQGETAWNLRGQLAAGVAENVSVVSAFALEHPSVSFDLLGTAKLSAIGSSFKLWVRAHPDAPSAQDLACGIERNADGTQDLYVWSQNAKQAVVTLPFTIDGRFRLRATVQDITSSTVLCRASVLGALPIATTFSAGPIAGGRYGFASSSAEVTIESLVIDANTVAQPF